MSVENPPVNGEPIKGLQNALRRAEIAVEVTGVFDQQTDAAVREFQTKRGFKVDGDVGPVTRTALGL